MSKCQSFICLHSCSSADSWIHNVICLQIYTLQWQTSDIFILLLANEINQHKDQKPFMNSKYNSVNAHTYQICLRHRASTHTQVLSLYQSVGLLSHFFTESFDKKCHCWWIPPSLHSTSNALHDMRTWYQWTKFIRVKFRLFKFRIFFVPLLKANTHSAQVTDEARSTPLFCLFKFRIFFIPLLKANTQSAQVTDEARSTPLRSAFCFDDQESVFHQRANTGILITLGSNSTSLNSASFSYPYSKQTHSLLKWQMRQDQHHWGVHFVLTIKNLSFINEQTPEYSSH